MTLLSVLSIWSRGYLGCETTMEPALCAAETVPPNPLPNPEARVQVPFVVFTALTYRSSESISTTPGVMPAPAPVGKSTTNYVSVALMEDVSGVILSRVVPQPCSWDEIRSTKSPAVVIRRPLDKLG